MVRDIAWLGHTKLILKADGEPALQALVRRVLEVARVECPEAASLGKEDPPAYDSQANGNIETGIRLIRGLFRTVKLCTEARIDKLIPVDHPITAWMLEHVCLLINAMVKGTDGLTAWHRIKGRPFGQQLLGFGESVLYRYPSKGPRHAPEGNMGALGGQGVFTGYNMFSSTFRIYTENGPLDARSITRRPEADRWSCEGLAGIRTLPGADKEQRSRPRLDQPASVTGPTADEVRPTQLRQLRINISDLRKFSHYNWTCPQCRHIERHGKTRQGGFHTELCRKELTEKMMTTEEGRARIKAHEERTDQVMAEHIEAQDGRPAPALPHDPLRPPSRSLDPFSGPSGDAPRVRPFLDPNGERDEAAAPRAPTIAPPRNALVRAQEETDGTAWQDIPGGETAPVTPRGTSQAFEPAVGAGVQEETADADMDAGNDVEMEFIGKLEVEDSLGSLDPSPEDFIAGLLLQQLGSLGRRYRREARQGARAIVSEVYSPPRVTKLLREAKMRHAIPGLALDLTVSDPLDGMPWDFSLPAKRRRARQLFAEQKPYIIIGSPECTHFCLFQAMDMARSKDVEAMKRAKTAAIVHLDFVAQLYADQISRGKYFLHEHPLRATSWTEDPIAKILQRSDVIRVHGDQCQYGAEVQSGPHAGRPILKPTGFMTNAPAVARALSLRCQGTWDDCSRRRGGQHQSCSGRYAREAAKYSKELCRC